MRRDRETMTSKTRKSGKETENKERSMCEFQLRFFNNFLILNHAQLRKLTQNIS
jgi:hypothetical protein